MIMLVILFLIFIIYKIRKNSFDKYIDKSFSIYRIEKFLIKLEDNRVLSSISNGMILSIPIVIVSSFAVVLSSLPIQSYQLFLETPFGREFSELLVIIINSTKGIISLIFLLTISYSYEQSINKSFHGLIPFISLCSYIAFSTNSVNGLKNVIFESSYSFNAIVISIISSVVFVKVFDIYNSKFKSNSYFENSTLSFMLLAMIPAIITISGFALLNIVIRKVFGVADFQIIFVDVLTNVFNNLNSDLYSGILLVLLLNILWFFGIHGGNVLDKVLKDTFVSGVDINSTTVILGGEPTGIISKTFLDTFVLFGGCGSLLCLVVAMLMFGKNKSIRTLTKTSILPVFFNVNELIMFGIPIILNPVYFIPFILTPFILMLTSYIATITGMVPYVVNHVEWTTPIFLSGYAATGSIKGSILQLFNLIIGIIIYMPFISFSNKIHNKTRKHRVNQLEEIVKISEKNMEKPILIGKNNKFSSVAKLMASDLEFKVKSNDITLFYQPQVNYNGELIGAEALLRWEYIKGEFVYPPLVIAIASEAGFLDKLEIAILEKACSDIKDIRQIYIKPIKISINITANQLSNKSFFSDMKNIIEKYKVEPSDIGLEITEQSVLSSSSDVTEKIREIRNIGIKLIMDDFGMGHSSLMYLRSNEFDMIKLDGGLVRDILTNERCSDIIASIMYLSNSLGFDVLAEYVETNEQRNKLYSLGCINYQGYLYGKAVSFEEFMKYVEGIS